MIGNRKEEERVIFRVIFLAYLESIDSKNEPKKSQAESVPGCEPGLLEQNAIAPPSCATTTATESVYNQSLNIDSYQLLLKFLELVLIKELNNFSDTSFFSVLGAPGPL